MILSHPIETPRLKLRPFKPSDAPTVQKLAGEWEVARYTLYIPHPYEDGLAELWIASHEEEYRRGALHLAITLDREQVIGAMGLSINKRHMSGELGYWIGRPYWNHGYGTEAARAMIAYAFDHLQLHRIEAKHVPANAASGRVMQKCGMTYEGTLRQAAFARGAYHDLALYSILRSEYND